MRHVLVVDDEPHICRIIQLTLSKEGYQVTIANDGKTGLENVRKNMPDFIIVDIDMPIMNGFEMCKRFLQEFPDSACQIIISTSRTEDEFKEWTEVYDNIHFLEKPLSFKVLLRTLAGLRVTAQ